MRTILFILSLCISYNAYAICAYPNPVYINTNSGGMYINLCGDESIKYATTTEGYILMQKGKNWYYTTLNQEGQLHVSDFIAEKKEYWTKELASYMENSNAAQTLTKLKSISTGKSYDANIITRRNTAIGSRKVLIVLMQFPDCNMTKTKSAFYDLFNAGNYTEDGARGSVKEYFSYVSYNTLQLQCDVIGPFTTKYNMAYYGGNVGFGGNDKNTYELFREALAHAGTQTNLNDYDADGDGYIDNIHIIYAGYGEEAGASSDAIWAHEATFPFVETGGIKIDRYSCAPELRSNRGNGISRIGPHCHEIGHALGAMDYYDTDYQEGGAYQGTGKWDLMGSGSWNEDGILPANINPYVKIYDLGWCKEVNISEDGNYLLKASDSNNSIFRLDTPTQGEFFLLENRQQKEFDSSVPGHGLLIYHIGAEIDSKKKTNTINASYPQYCHIECASNTYRRHHAVPESYGETNGAGTPFPGISGNNVFNYDSTPAALCNNGNSADFAISDIMENEDGTISLNIELGDTRYETKEPSTNGEIIWQDSFDNFLTTSYWTQQPIVGATYWKYAKTVSQPNRNSYIAMSPLYSPFGDNLEKEVTRLILNISFLNNDEYTGALKLSTNSIEIKEPNNINIYVATEDNDRDTLVAEFAVQSDTWESHSFNFHKNDSVKFLIIEGVCWSKTDLLLDDFCIHLKEYAKGDVNHDGKITIDDANIIVNYFLGIITESEIDKKVADINGDGEITLTDADAILNIFLQIIQ